MNTPTIKFSHPTYSVAENSNAAYLTFTRTGDLNTDSSVTLNITGGSATRDSDYFYYNGWYDGDMVFYEQPVYFGWGQAQTTVGINIASDWELEDTEDVTFELTNPYNVNLDSQSTATLEIIDVPPNTPTVEFSHATYSISENTGAVQALVTLNRSGDLNQTSEVQLNLTGGSATQDVDYTLSSTTAYFDYGQSQTTVPVQILPDAEVESLVEDINLELASLSNANIGSQSAAVVQISDSSPASGSPTVEFSHATYSVTENNQSSVQTAITLTRTGDLSAYSDVQINITGGSASQDIDYYWNYPTASFNPGEAQTTVYVDVPGWDEVEPTENITFELSPGTNATIGSQSNATVEILDNTITPTVEFAQPTYSISEYGATVQAIITLNRTGDLNQYSEVQLNVTGGSATQDSDYYLYSPTAYFYPGEGQTNVYIDIPWNGELEGTEDITFELVSNSNANIGNQSSAALEILDAPVPSVEFSQATYSVSENGVPARAEITLNRTGDVMNATEVQLNITGGSATQDADYILFKPTVIFNPWEESKTISLGIPWDSETEATEDVSFEITGVSNATIGTQNTANVEIADSPPPTESPTVEFAHADYTISENGTTVQALVTLNRTGDLSNYSEVIVNGGGGSATQDSDYYLNSPTAYFYPGEASTTFYVDIPWDGQVEGNEAINLNLTNLSNAMIGSQSTANLTIIDAPVPTVEFSAPSFSASASENSYNGSVTLTRTGDLNNYSEVQLNVTGGSASQDTDYYFWSPTASFYPGQSQTQVGFGINWDAEVEGSEDINFELAGVSNAVIGTESTATFNILDAAQPTIEFSQPTYTTSENGSSAILTLNRTGDLSQSSEAYISITGGTATQDSGTANPDSDYYFWYPTASFGPGQAQTTISVDSISWDTQVEGTENISFELTGGYNATIGSQNTTNVDILDVAHTTPTIEFSQPTYSISENTGAVQAAITLTRTGDLNSESEVQLNVVGGSATADTDYVAYYPTGYFGWGQSQTTVYVDILADTEVETAEDINFELASLSNANIGNQNTATLQINDFDAANAALPPTVAFTQSTYAVTEDHNNWTQALLTLNRTGDLSQPSEVQLNVTGGSATQDSDYYSWYPTAYFGSGQAQTTVNVDIPNDYYGEVEGTEDVLFDLVSIRSVECQ
ncbi:MAG TPA: hypothetical protein IGS52_06795 [Oscillatoriaceae cyanobacterium M33_DOE_052]|nr:hypothetical protein [Oscillatoriaceae cyanobacterium M33_DOE_052]